MLKRRHREPAILNEPLVYPARIPRLYVPRVYTAVLDDKHRAYCLQMAATQILESLNFYSFRTKEKGQKQINGTSALWEAAISALQDAAQDAFTSATRASLQAYEP